MFFWQRFYSDDLFLHHHFFNWRMNILEIWLFNLTLLALFICSNGIILNTIHLSDLLPFCGSIMICFLRQVLMWEWMKPQDSTPDLMSLGYFIGVIMIQMWAWRLNFPFHHLSIVKESHYDWTLSFSLSHKQFLTSKYFEFNHIPILPSTKNWTGLLKENKLRLWSMMKQIGK